MVDINVDIEDALIITEKFEDTKDNVYNSEIQWGLRRIGKECCTVNVAEAAGLALFCVMKTTCPIDCHVTFAAVQPCSTLHTATCAYAAKFEETVKDWAVVAHVETALLFLVRLHIVRCHFLEEFDVFVRVELGHLKIGSWLGALQNRSASCGWWYLHQRS